MRESLMTKVLTNDNPSDLMTRVIADQKRFVFVGNTLYDIYDEHQ